ncbi:MAG: hypothetical protein COV55_02750 [Candidatus Komeilibacteria bacterium CG11_big_fil_rev_8_21_14_0_20_36_20]|uniref:NrS-1 polymerase-like helicase domain-containing protein n=1 Tax=Candidatus Komeilibacteria bacterium CG11_big_fil_rev_8_21_14_0_20_36_20 TaxID=1974477 RepID=A0A2H0NCN1_9BACT|nr:MAG: hypothetical protein COV55_02750 [Candidatus Komeilibacteria bacterium CG11_big_fil_rev_8_21_14_0_20_36_20]
MLIELFIKAGWYTVPLKGELKRLESGKKTIPIYEKDWNKKYAKEFNTKTTLLAAALTGKQSNIIAIDCDNQATYDIFKSLDPNYNFHFVSKGKPEGGGTILYKYTDKVGGFQLKNDCLELDFFSDEGCVYLPTEENYTKESWVGKTELPEIKEAPSNILALLKTLKSKRPDNVAKSNQVKTTISNRLAPLLDVFVKNEKYDPGLFKIITPYSFRDLPSYVKKGHLHPNDIPNGRGSEYLSKVSAILGADISVNVETYTRTMLLINSFWEKPLNRATLFSTIVNPMVESKATINGVPIWQYDPHWEKMGFIATAINGDYLESFFDDIKSTYYLINYSVPYIKGFNEKRQVINTLKTLMGRSVTEMQYDSTKQIVRTVLNPSLEFGHIEATDRYNLFRQSEELAIINNPLPYKTNYNKPIATLNYLESLIPDDTMRMFVLSFLKTKFTTFKYSPIIIYLIGKPGSGKDTLVNIIRRIIGDEYVSKPDTRVFVEQYNGWMLDKFFIQLDEYGNKLTRNNEKQEVLGKLKAYTGSEEMQIRAMRSDGFNYKHCISFIMTANNNPLPVEMDDRRFAFINTPNKLEAQPWVKDMGGISNVQDRIKQETQDFCYYLGTEIPKLSSDKYVIAPMNEDKEKLIIDSLPAAEQIVYYVRNSQFDMLKELASEFSTPSIDEMWEKNRLESERLEALYMAMTEGAGSTRTLIRLMKREGFKRSHTTKKGENHFYYYINDLHNFKQVEQKEEDFLLDEAKQQIKGLE